MALYLDDELCGEEARIVESHLEACASCAAAIAEERRFLEALRSIGPVVRAPASLRARVAGILEDTAACEARRVPAGGSAPRSPYLTLRGSGSSIRRVVLRHGAGLRAAAAMAAVVIAGLWVLGEVSGVRPAPGTSEFARVAVASHERYVRGGLPLELASAAPDAISAWFDGKVPFDLALPNYQEFSDQDLSAGAPPYRIEGARLVGFQGDYAAFVAYRMGERPISLLVTSIKQAAPAGGETVALKGLVFHHDTVGGLKVISWSHRGLTYALVSSLAEPGHQSCMVCHQGTPDRDFIEHSGPRD